MSEPLRLTFPVACPPAHAFQVWTARIAAWWPADHTVSGSAEATVVLEAGVGGRIYERVPDGSEHLWGEVTVWEPPHRLGYRWHLGQPASQATDVEVRFDPLGASQTLVAIVHTGFDQLGSSSATARARNAAGWQGLLPHFTAAAVGADASGPDREAQ